MRKSVSRIDITLQFLLKHFPESCKHLFRQDRICIITLNCFPDKVRNIVLITITVIVAFGILERYRKNDHEVFFIVEIARIHIHAVIRRIRISIDPFLMVNRIDMSTYSGLLLILFQDIFKLIFCFNNVDVIMDFRHIHIVCRKLSREILKTRKSKRSQKDHRHDSDHDYR